VGADLQLRERRAPGRQRCRHEGNDAQPAEVRRLIEQAGCRVSGAGRVCREADMSATEPLYLLYGAPHSLYTAKARAYLRKQGVAYCERMPTHPDFTGRILPQIRRGIIPVLETPAGDIIQDIIDIIDHFEAPG